MSTGGTTFLEDATVRQNDVLEERSLRRPKVFEGRSLSP
jgi:hypothetical protein